MTTIPPYLKKGDTIGVVCPAGFMPAEKADTCLSVLQQWGYKVRVGKTLGSQYHYFSGTDEERLNDLQEMLDDKNVDAVLCARGGYGLSRIVDKLDFKKFRKKPKWIIGFSDITVLQAHIFRRFDTASIHSPMAAAFNDEEYKNEFVQSLQKALTGKKARYQALPHDFNKTGKASARLVGGNLALLAHLTGTPSEFKTAGKILFLEDVGEYIYNIDRMLYQLKRSGKLDKLAGLIIGKFSEVKDTTIPFGKDVYEVIRDAVKEFDYPVCFQFPISHDKENYALKIGLPYKFVVSEKGVILKEL